MVACEVCGGHSERAFQVMLDGTRHLFDSAECAIHAATRPREYCGCLHHSGAGSLQTVGSARGSRTSPRRTAAAAGKRGGANHSNSKTW